MGVNNQRLEINTRMRANALIDECLTAHIWNGKYLEWQIFGMANIRNGKYPERYSLVNFYPDTEK
jgi:hypothetical protein